MYTSFYWYDTGNAHVFYSLTLRFEGFLLEIEWQMVVWSLEGRVLTFRRHRALKLLHWGDLFKSNKADVGKTTPSAFFAVLVLNSSFLERERHDAWPPASPPRITSVFSTKTHPLQLNTNERGKKDVPRTRLLVSVDWWRIYNSGYRRTVRLNVQNLCKAWDDCRGWRWAETLEQSSAAGHCSFSPKYLVLELYLVTRMWMLSLFLNYTHTGCCSR